jgi:DNA-binding SARP family transcriptional activator
MLLDFVPYDEEGNNQLLRCYAKLDDSAGIVEHYRWLVRILREEYDMEPAVSTRGLYKKLYGERFS